MDLIHYQLKPRHHNILITAGITTIEKLKETSDSELLALPGLSKADLWIIHWDVKHSSLPNNHQESGVMTRDTGPDRQDQERYAEQNLAGGNQNSSPINYINRIFDQIAAYLTRVVNWMMRFISALFKGAADAEPDTAATERDEFPDSPATDSVPSGSTERDEFFEWPTTDAPAAKHGFGDNFDYEVGLLKYVGYRVGRTKGEKLSIRWRILDWVFRNTLPNVGSIEYMRKWGEPNTEKRLKQMVVTITSLAKLCQKNADATNNDFSKAIRDYETDLNRLYRKYYVVGKFGFEWPKTDIED